VELAPGTCIDRYTVEARLGAGGMGTVYRVRHRDLGSLHALKILHHASPALRDRLVQEGRLQGSLQHPGVLRVTDLVQVEGLPALVLEYVEGETLADRIRGGGVPPQDRDGLIQRLLDGVAAAHRHGLIHRDLKPENVLLAQVDGQLQPKVADFGLARALDSDGPRLTVSHTPMGTPAYMAPEQFQDASRVDGRADVFSLGAILYEVVTGQMAFEGSLPEILGKAGWGTFTPVRTLAPQTPQAWVDAIEGALRPEPHQRIPSVEALLAAWTGQGRAAAPAPEHPPLQALLEAPDDPEHSAHLAGCAPCRVELRLYRQAFEGQTLHPTDRRWPGRLAGAALGLLGTVVVLAGVLGGLGNLLHLGFWLWIFLVLGAGGGTLLAEGRRSLTAGGDPGLVRWIAAPVLLLIVGQLACGAGARVALGAIALAPLDIAPVLIAAGSMVTLSAWSAAQLVSVPFLLGAVILVVLVRRSVARLGAWAPWPAGLAIGGGGAMWLAESLVATDRTATLLVYGTVAVAGLVCSLLPDERPEDGPARLIAAVAAALAGASAALGVQVQDLRGLHMGATEIRWDHPAEAVQTAADFALAWSAAFNPWTVAWVLLSVCVGVLVVAQTNHDHLAPPARRRQLARLSAVLGFGVAPAVAWNAQVVQQLTDQIVPAWRAAAIAQWLPAVHLAPQGPGLRLDDGASEPLQPGDRLVAVGDRTVTDLASIVALVDACRCPGGCDALPKCLSGATKVSLTVAREGRLMSVMVPWSEPAELSR